MCRWGSLTAHTGARTSSVQGMITLARYGVGMLIGFWIAGLIVEKYATVPGHK